MNVLYKDLLNTIRNNFKRYISIIIIIFLGVAFYIGMSSSPKVLKNSMGAYLDKYNYGDLKLSSEIGLTGEELDKIKDNVEEISQIEGKYYTSAITNLKNESGKATDYEIFVHSYNRNDKINVINIVEGRLTNSNNECVVSTNLKELGLTIGDEITFTTEALKNKNYKIVGFVNDPQYITRNRGIGTIQGGMVNYFAYVNDENFNNSANVYTIADIKLKHKYDNFDEEYSNYLDDVKGKIDKEASKLLEERQQKIIEEKQKELDNAEEEYNKKKSSVDDEFKKVEIEISNAEKQLNQAKMSLLPDKKIDDYMSGLKADLNSSKATLDALRSALNSSRNTLNILNTFNNNDLSQQYINEVVIPGIKPAYSDMKQEFLNLYSPLNDLQQSVKSFNCDDVVSYNTGGNNPDLTNICNQAYSTLKDKASAQNKAVNDLVNKTTELDTQIEETQNLSDIINVYTDYVNYVQRTYDASSDLYNTAVKEYDKTYNQLKVKNAEARNQVAIKQNQLNQAKQQYESKKKAAYESLESVYKEIIENKKILQKKHAISSIIYTRDDSYGFGSFSEDVTRVNKFAKILPVLFFVVASLITATSITRLIQEERSKIGIMKSLGCTKRQIINKYIIYSLSANVIGFVLGLLVGVYIFPNVIAKAHELTYYIPKIIYIYDFKIISIALTFSLVTTVLVSLLSAFSVSREIPARLMRKKRLKFYPVKENRMAYQSFDNISLAMKSSVRNIRFNPLRSFMTIVGVIGCTALLITSFCVRDSLSRYIKVQFNKIYNIDTEFFYKNDISQYEINNDYTNLKKDDHIISAAIGRKELVTVNNDKTLITYTVVPDTLKDFEKNIGIYSTITKKKISLKNQNGVVITEKLAKLLNLKKGDTINFTDSSNVNHSALITDIAENYLFNYIYMNKEVYKEIYDYQLINNYLVVKYADDIKNEDEDTLIYKSGKYSNYLSMQFYKTANEEVVKRLDVLVIVIIISAGLLAFVVLYNISKINISEKVTEIATLKVLGYTSKEISKIINYEINILKYIGILLGIFGGYLLTDIVLTSTEMNFMMFYHNISIKDYIYGILLTIVFSKFINIMIGKDIKLISMAKSLKVTEE